MKHNFSFLPSLRRTTLLALLCLGIMPIWAKTYTAKIQIGDDGTNTKYYAYDDNGTVKAKTDATTWYLEECGTASDQQLYYIRTADNKYMYIDKTKQMSANGGWPTYRVKTANTNGETNDYKWFVAKGNWGDDIRHIVSYTDGRAAAKVDDNNNNPKWLVLNRRNWVSGWRWIWDYTDPDDAIACGADIQEGGDTYGEYKCYFIDKTEVASCVIPTSTTIYVDVTNFTGRYSGSNYYLSLVSQSNSTIDLSTNKDNYVCRNETKWYTMAQVSGNIYSATIDVTNIGMISIWNKDVHDYNNPNEVNVAGQINYDCTNNYNLFTISSNPTQVTGIDIFTGTWSSYTPTDPCPNCGTVPAN